MVHPGATTWQFTPHLIAISGTVSMGLFVLAVRAYRRTKDTALLFLAGAFTLFGVKNFVLGYGMYTVLWPPAVIGIADVVVDLIVVLLFVVPLLMPRR